MPIPRPKILTRVTFDTDQAFDFDVSHLISLDTNVTGVVPAGDYYVAWDNTDDDLLHALALAMTDALEPDPPYYAGQEQFAFHINSDHKIVLTCVGGDWTGTQRDIRINWANWGSDLKKALGVTKTSSESLTGVNNNSTTFDEKHGFGWYATDDGLLEFYDWADINMREGVQSMSVAGRQRGVEYGSRYINRMILRYLPADLVWSDGNGYGDSPRHPRAMNQPLECWWNACRSGNPFRVYYDGALVDTARAAKTGTLTATNDTQLTHSGAGFETNQFVGGLAYVGDFFSAPSDVPMRSKILTQASGNTLTTEAPHTVSDRRWTTGQVYHLFEHTYGEYQIDLEEMEMFEPTEIPVRDEYDIEIPLVRYIA